MPSSVGHGLMGLSVAWFVASVRSAGARSQSRSQQWALALVCVALAVLPDVDLMFGVHRGPTHSLGAVLLVSLAAAGYAWWRRLPVLLVAVSCGLAYASHLVLDWLGKDSRTPRGIMLCWPWSSEYYTSGADLFLEISRRYWLPDEVIWGNLRSIGWELVLLLPLLALAWMLRLRAMNGGR
ncbi:MAG: metal-dependent hydrolase [Acidobacteria bacterium]|nr:MAG: metal-dependent hydrolase [Acidobacteriota bacterium]